MTLGLLTIKDKLDFIKMKNFSSKDTIKNVKKKATEKMFVLHVSDKRHTSRRHKELVLQFS